MARTHSRAKQNHDGVITHLEPDILASEVRYPLGIMYFTQCYPWITGLDGGVKTGNLMFFVTFPQDFLGNLGSFIVPYSLEGLMLKLKLQYFGHLMWRVDSSEKTLMLGKIEGRRRGQKRMRWLDAITDTMNMGLGGLRGC